MLIVLFVFEVIIVALTVLTTHMVEHKLSSIRASLNMYYNKRTYKTKADIDFIEDITMSYKKLYKETGEEMDLESAIRRKLLHESIGRFAYLSVKNIAIKVKNLMWGVLIIEVLIAWMNHMAMDGQAVIVITASLLLTVITAIYSIIRGLEEKGEALVDEIMHYVKNIYPLEEKKKKNSNLSVVGNTISLEEHKEKKGERKSTEQKGEDKKVEKELTEILKETLLEEDLPIHKNEEELSAVDIAKLLKSL